jgi:intracellular multiplication protein IcmE
MRHVLNRLRMIRLLNQAALGGPRRLIVIGAGMVMALGVVAVASMSGSTPSLQSRTAGMPAIDPLPGGLHSNPEQEKLALAHAQSQADEAARRGMSYTPPIAASEPNAPPSAVSPAATPAAAPLVSNQKPENSAMTRQRLSYAPDPAVRPVAQVQPDPNEERSYADAVNRLLRGWDGRTPQTDVIMQPDSGLPHNGPEGNRTSYAPRTSSERSDAESAVLMPAGRGLFAHTVLAVDSDSSGPIVLQADSGPLAGDRMIGAFSKAGANGGAAADRLVVRVNSIEHRGQSIPVDAIVIAPDTMETTVASSVDEHYLARFVLPAAAAFVQGLGQALATTSNTTGVLSPLGGSSYVTQLNLPQQLGVGAGVAAAQVGNTLNQQAPRSPTIHLDANADVGVMFLAPVRENRAP